MARKFRETDMEVRTMLKEKIDESYAIAGIQEEIERTIELMELSGLPGQVVTMSTEIVKESERRRRGLMRRVFFAVKSLVC
jgi:VIT1/CCC1 family predicted Fe2+/Mn2+ transporter